MSSRTGGKNIPQGQTNSLKNAGSSTSGYKPMFKLGKDKTNCCPKCLLRDVPNRIACSCTAPFAVCAEHPDACESNCPFNKRYE